MKEGDNRQGPSLAGIVGRRAGSLPGFNYSPSMKQSGITWDEANLDQFIADPEQVVSGNTMKPYGGIERRRTAQGDRRFSEVGRLTVRVASAVAHVFVAELSSAKWSVDALHQPAPGFLLLRPAVFSMAIVR